MFIYECRSGHKSDHEHINVFNKGKLFSVSLETINYSLRFSFNIKKLHLVTISLIKYIFRSHLLWKLQIIKINFIIYAKD